MNHTISGVDFQRAARLGAIVGYHNYFQVGVFDAVKLVQAHCPPGVTASAPLGRPDSFPYGVFRVGQVRVHHGDQSFPLLVNARDWLTAELAAGR